MNTLTLRKTHNELVAKYVIDNIDGLADEIHGFMLSCIKKACAEGGNYQNFLYSLVSDILWCNNGGNKECIDSFIEKHFKINDNTIIGYRLSIVRRANDLEVSAMFLLNGKDYDPMPDKEEK